MSAHFLLFLHCHSLFLYLFFRSSLFPPFLSSISFLPVFLPLITRFSSFSDLTFFHSAYPRAFFSSSSHFSLFSSVLSFPPPQAAWTIYAVHNYTACSSFLLNRSASSASRVSINSNDNHFRLNRAFSTTALSNSF